MGRKQGFPTSKAQNSESTLGIGGGVHSVFGSLATITPELMIIGIARHAVRTAIIRQRPAPPRRRQIVGDLPC